MEEKQAFENRVLERLNAGRSVRSFLIAAVELLAEAVNLLVLQVFRKDDYAVKYAVEPLLLGDGPLGELSVRLKLIYGLGVISRHEYEDGELLLALREELNHDSGDYRLPTMRSWARLVSCTASPPGHLRRCFTPTMLSCAACSSSAICRWCDPPWSCRSPS